eukprot:11436060-Alexandrium_andersonii.AAC.1
MLPGRHASSYCLSLLVPYSRSRALTPKAQRLCRGPFPGRHASSYCLSLLGVPHRLCRGPCFLILSVIACSVQSLPSFDT